MSYNILITFPKWDVNFGLGRGSYLEYICEYSPALTTLFKIIDFIMCSAYA